MAKIKVKGVKKDIVLPIKVHSSYYYLVRNSMMMLLDRQPDAKQALINASSSLEMTLDETFIQISMAILKEIETVAIESNQFEEEEIEVPDEPLV
jgi:hypothetical protein